MIAIRVQQNQSSTLQEMEFENIDDPLKYLRFNLYCY